MDDYPLHQIAETIRHVGSSDRFELAGQIGYGLHEYGFFGPFDRYSLEGFNEGAPARGRGRKKC